MTPIGSVARYTSWLLGACAIVLGGLAAIAGPPVPAHRATAKLDVGSGGAAALATDAVPAPFVIGSPRDADASRDGGPALAGAGARRHWRPRC